MRQTSIWAILLFVCVSSLAAQRATESVPFETEALTEGTWINMRFIEHLKVNKSFTKALGILRPNELLVMRAVREDSMLVFYTSRSLDNGEPTDVRIQQNKGLGEQRRISAFGETWLLGISKARNEYIALHSTVDSNAKPDVFAVIPSRNQNADFIYQRVLNSSTLSGVYRDSKGKVFSFNAKQHAITPKLEFNYRIVVAPDKPYQIMEVVSDNPKERLRYAYEWKREKLVLSTIGKNGKLKHLYTLTSMPKR